VAFMFGGDILVDGVWH